MIHTDMLHIRRFCSINNMNLMQLDVTMTVLIVTFAILSYGLESNSGPQKGLSYPLEILRNYVTHTQLIINIHSKLNHTLN